MNKSEFNMEIEDFVKFPESDVDPEAPQISLELTVRPELYLDAPFTIWSTLRYEPSEQETEDHPVTVQWDLAEANRNLILLRQTANGFEKVEIKKDETQNGTNHEVVKENGHKQDEANGDEVKLDEVKTNGVKHEGVRQDEPMPDQPSQNETKQDEPTQDPPLQDETRPAEIKDQLMPDRPKEDEVKQDEPTPTSTPQDQLMPDLPPQNNLTPNGLTPEPQQNNITPEGLVEEPEDISTPTPQPTLKISLSNPDLTSLTLSFPTPPSPTSTSSVTTQTIPPSVPVETMSSLPRTYHPFLKPDQTYVLVFPGCSVPLLGQEGEGNDEGEGKGKGESVVIPGTWTTEFEVREREIFKGVVPMEEEELFVPTRLGRANTVPSFRMSFHE